MKPSLLLYGLRTAQPRQLRARALRPLHRRQLGSGSPPPFHPLDGPTELWRSPAFESRPLAGAGPERLRGFHAHYGEDVLGAAEYALYCRAVQATDRRTRDDHPLPTDMVGIEQLGQALDRALSYPKGRKSRSCGDVDPDRGG